MSNFSFQLTSAFVIASHAGVFRGARFSSLPWGGKTSSPKNACVGVYLCNSAIRIKPGQNCLWFLLYHCFSNTKGSSGSWIWLIHKVLETFELVWFLSAEDFKKRHFSPRNTDMWYWSSDYLSCRLSIDHKMKVQYIYIYTSYWTVKCVVSWDINSLRVTLYFGEPVGRVKIQEMSKHIPRYYTPDRPVRDLLFNSSSIK